MKGVALLKDYVSGSEIGKKLWGRGPWDEQQEEQMEPGQDVVLDHIILDMTGKSDPIDRFADPSTMRAVRRKKRLLRHSNTVLISRLGIMALVSTMVAVTTLLTWYFTSTYSSRSVKSLASVLRQELVQTSLQAMSYTLGEVYNATVVLGSLQQLSFYSSSNNSWNTVEPELRRINKGVFNAQAQYSSVAFISPDGRVTDYSRSKQSAYLEYFFFVNTTYTESSTPIWYWQNVTGLVDETQAAPAILRQPPYPLSAENLLTKRVSEQVYWTMAPNIFGEATVSPAVPAMDIVTNQFLGLATITSTFQKLDSYLSTVNLLEGYLYFAWRNSTDNSEIVASSFGSSTDTLTNPKNASNAFVRAAALFLDSRYGDTFLSLNETHNDDVKLLGEAYYIDTVPLLQKPYDVLNLTAVMIVPRKSIMGKIDERNHIIVRVSIAASVGVLVLGCCFICFITSKMSIEMQLRQELIKSLVAKHRAEQSSNYKSQFLANMSHELRTPIAGITGLLDLLCCDSLTPDQEISVSQIRSCATELLALVNNVLDISKVEAGRMELEAVAFSVTDELESLVDIFAVQSPNVDVVLDLSDEIPPTVIGDVTRTRQIFNNLLSNSMKFTTQGHVLVRGWVDQSLLERDEKWADFSMNLLARREKVSGPLNFMRGQDQVALVFEVHDTGCGIPVELHESVFDSFVQADSSTTRTHGGSGLGLYIVRSLVELMGGEVAIVPTEGPGTLVRFHIIVGRALSPSKSGRVFGDVQGYTIGSELDWVNYGLGPRPDPPEPRRRSTSKVLERSQILVAMHDGAAQKAAVQWLQKHGSLVTIVESWEAVLPTLEGMLRNDSAGVGNHVGIDHVSHVNSLESSNTVSQNTTGGARLPSVLALVDVTMHSSLKEGVDDKLVEHDDVGSCLSRIDCEKLSSHMQEMLNGMLRIHSHHPVAVGWIVAPGCGVVKKQALQADGRFEVIKKPLFGRRMKRLFDLLSSAQNLEQRNGEVHSSHPGSPSTPMLRSMGNPNSDERSFTSRATDCNEHSRENLGPACDTSSNSILASRDGDGTGEKHLEDPGGQGLVPDKKGLPPCGESAVLPVNHGVGISDQHDTHETIPQSAARVSNPPKDISNGVRAEMEHATANGSPGMQRNHTNEKGVEDQQSKSVMDVSLLGKAQLKQSNDARGPVSDKETFAVPPNGTTVGHLPPSIRTKASAQSSNENMTSSPMTNFTASNSAAAFGKSALANLHILLVEDTPVLQKLASMMLKKLGANVTVVGDGQQAIVAVTEAMDAKQCVTTTTLSYTPHFDLILMDCAMPVMDGYNATKAIRAAEENTDRHIPIVALTAHALASDEERCLSVGMDAYLTKPINCKLMVTTIQNLVVKNGETV